MGAQQALSWQSRLAALNSRGNQGMASGPFLVCFMPVTGLTFFFRLALGVHCRLPAFIGIISQGAVMRWVLFLIFFLRPHFRLS